MMSEPMVPRWRKPAKLAISAALLGGCLIVIVAHHFSFSADNIADYVIVPILIAVFASIVNLYESEDKLESQHNLAQWLITRTASAAIVASQLTAYAGGIWFTRHPSHSTPGLIMIAVGTPLLAAAIISGLTSRFLNHLIVAGLLFWGLIGTFGGHSVESHRFGYAALLVGSVWAVATIIRDVIDYKKRRRQPATPSDISAQAPDA